MSEKEYSHMNFFVRLIRHDFARKLIAILFAVLIMLAVHMNTQETRTFLVNGVEVDLELPENYVFKTREPPRETVTLTVEVTGMDSVVKSDHFKNRFKITKKITKYDADKGVVKLLSGDVKDSRGKSRLFSSKLNVTDIKPDKIVLNLDEMTERKIPVIASMDTGKLKKGYTLGASPIPQEFREVTVTGPKSIISNIQEVRTEEIPLEDATSNFTATVSLKKVAAPDVSYSFDQITIPVKIYGRRERELASIPVKALIPLPNPAGTVYTIEPDVVRVRFEEPMTEDRTGPGDLHPTIDVSGLQGRTQCKVSCVSGKADVTIREIEPEFVTLTVTAPEKKK